MQKEELIPNLFKSEYSKIIAVLCNLFGIKHIEIAEDIVNDTFLLASETWGQKGIPENPAAWLYTVAKNKTKDYLKRNQNFNGPILAEIKATQPDFEEMKIDLSSQNISDSQLQMLFAVCNPAIPIEAQIGLALRILCGFGIDEIAEAFLSNKETINKRLFRAKEKLKEENIKLELPDPTEINKRMDRVLTTLYLLFNEGYYSKTQSTKLNKELCLEAMRLNYLLIENPSTNTPMANALMSLMCFHSSRFDARISESGESILYDNQDKNLWNEDLIAKGNYFLIESAKGQVVSKYHLEASIAYWHSTKIDSPKKWENILQLYNKLLQIDYSPMAALNRTYALSQANGKLQAIAEAEKLNMTESHLYYALLGNLYTEIDPKIARAHYSTAFAMAKTDADKATIAKSLASIEELTTIKKRPSKFI
jgi:RNA polymerase sigma factor (sigma-70 family)